MLTSIWVAVIMICVRESFIVVIKTARHVNVTRSTVEVLRVLHAEMSPWFVEEARSIVH